MRQEDTSKPRSARWRVLGRLSTLRTVASIMMTALFLSGCATSRKASVATEESVKQVSADTLQSEVRQTWTETVPQEEAKLEIPLAELTNLPERQSTEPRTDEPAQPCRTKVAPSLCMPLATVCNASASTMNARLRATRKHWSNRRMKPERKKNAVQIRGRCFSSPLLSEWRPAQY